jgi:hypothetical protein
MISAAHTGRPVCEKAHHSGTHGSSKKLWWAWRKKKLLAPILDRCNLILRTVVSSRSPSVTHSFHYAGAPYKYLYGGAPYKSPKIAENCASCGGCGSLAARVADTYHQKSLSCRKKRRLRRISEVQPDLRGSLIVPRTVKSSCAGLTYITA